MKKLSCLFAVVLLAGVANAAITIPSQDLLDDSYFTTNTLGIPDSSVGAPEYWRYKARVPAEDSDVQLNVGTNTSFAGNNDSFSAPIDILSHSWVTNLPYYDADKATLESINPAFSVDDFTFFTSANLYQTNAPTAAQVYNGWYVITLDTAGGTYTATSDVENIMTPTATNNAHNFTILSEAWNNITWDVDPFAGGGVPYTNINDVSIEFFYTNIVPVTTLNNAWWHLRHASVYYDVSLDAVDAEAPAAPTNLTASIYPVRVDLDWNDNLEADLVSYNVMRSTNSGIGYVTITNLASSFFSDANVVNDTTYYYVVSALDYAGNESSNSTEVAATPVDNPPSAPTGLVALGSDGEVLLDWDNNLEPEDDLDSYKVYRSDTSGSGYVQIASNLADSAYTDSDVSNGSTYYYVVTAVDDAAQESGYSDEASTTPEAKTIINVANLLDDPTFTSNPDPALTTAKAVEQYRYYNERIQIQTDDDTAVDGDNSSFTAPITLTDDAEVTTNARYNVATTTLDAITPNFQTGTAGINMGSVSRLVGSAEVNGWYIITLDTAGGTYTATSGVANLFFSNDGVEVQNHIVGQWNTLNWDVDPFASGGIVYQDINDVGIEFFHYSEQAVTNSGGLAMWFNMYAANIGYTATLYEGSGSAYDTWAAGYELSGGQTDDDDGDGLSNIHEFGVGGNPTNSGDIGYEPTLDMVDVTGTNWMEYVHVRQTDPESGLGYSLEENMDLVYGTWTNATATEMGSAVLPGDADFESVTNHVPTTEAQKFIRLKVEQN